MRKRERRAVVQEGVWGWGMREEDGRRNPEQRADEEEGDSEDRRRNKKRWRRC